jgi:AAA15 family ATPase/GTPase
MMWKTLNELLNKPKKNSTKISKTFIENCSSNIIDDPKTIADNFNDYFINIGPNLQIRSNVYNNNNCFEKYLKGSYQSSFFLNPITENELEIELKSMKSKKCCGYDGILNTVFIQTLPNCQLKKSLSH